MPFVNPPFSIQEQYEAFDLPTELKLKKPTMTQGSVMWLWFIRPLFYHIMVCVLLCFCGMIVEICCTGPVTSTVAYKTNLNIVLLHIVILMLTEDML